MEMEIEKLREKNKAADNAFEGTLFGSSAPNPFEARPFATPQFAPSDDPLRSAMTGYGDPSAENVQTAKNQAQRNWWLPNRPPMFSP